MSIKSMPLHAFIPLMAAVYVCRIPVTYMIAVSGHILLFLANAPCHVVHGAH